MQSRENEEQGPASMEDEEQRRRRNQKWLGSKCNNLSLSLSPSLPLPPSLPPRIKALLPYYE